jgi:hypothetical protein
MKKRAMEMMQAAVLLTFAWLRNWKQKRLEMK